MGSSTDLAADLSSRIEAGLAISDSISLEVFKTLYGLQSNSENRRKWTILLLGDQAIAQAHGMPVVVLEVRENPSRYYTGEDFAFTDPLHDNVAGSTGGKYSFNTFLQDVVSPIGIFRLTCIWVITALLLYNWGTSQVHQSLATSLLSALALFVSIFSLFVLGLDAERDSAYLLEGRYRKLVAADKYIASVGLTALALAMLYTIVAAVETTNPHTWTGIPISGLGGLTLATTSLSFYLVVGYHFNRRHEMTEIQMARAFLRNTNHPKG